MVEDSHGNIFGTAESQPNGGSGTIFELVNSNGSYAFKTLYTFPDGIDGTQLTIDGSGNLFGFTAADSTPSVFELVNNNGAYTLQTIYTFPPVTGFNIPFPVAATNLVANAKGDLFGTCQSVSSNAAFTDSIFELVNNNGTYTYQVLGTFQFNSQPALSFLDANGNLFGTTSGANGGATVFEISPGGGTDGNPAANSANVNYVNCLYNTILGRTPDAAGLASWVSLLDHGTDRTTGAYDILHSTEYDAGQVRTLYLEYLQRDPDPAGLADWTHLLMHGGTLELVAAGILASSEFAALQGTSNSQFVAALYRGPPRPGRLGRRGAGLGQHPQPRHDAEAAGHGLRPVGRASREAG